VARTLGGDRTLHIRNRMGYVLGVARLIWLERVKAEMSQRGRHGHYETTRMHDAEEAPIIERNVAILDRCLCELTDDDRALLLGYHEGRGRARIARRQRLGQDLGINAGLLRTRIHRLRVQVGRRADELLGAHEALPV
jgi:hypothetical protein